MFDVIEVEIAKPHTVRVMERNKTEANAEAIVNMAVMRRGCEHHFYKAVPAGSHADGQPLPQKA